MQDICGDVLLNGPESTKSLENWMVISQDYSYFANAILASLWLHCGKNNSNMAYYLVKIKFTLLQLLSLILVSFVSTPETRMTCALAMTSNWMAIPLAILIAKCSNACNNGYKAYCFSEIAAQVGALSFLMLDEVDAMLKSANREIQIHELRTLRTVGKKSEIYIDQIRAFSKSPDETISSIAKDILDLVENPRPVPN